MVGRLEFIKLLRTAGRRQAVAVLFFTFVWLPILYALISLFCSLDFTSVKLNLNSSFFWILLRSCGFALAQASLSLFFIAGIAFVLGYLDFFIGFNVKIKKMFHWVALGIFSLSPTLVALNILNLLETVHQEKLRGLFLVVLFNVLINVGFIGSLFLGRLERMDYYHSHDQIAYIQSLGGGTRMKIRYLFGPIFWQDFKSWSAQIFLWCFASFAPVLLLANTPHQSTPEILLFYSALNDSTGSRLLLIVLVTLLLSMALNFGLRNRSNLPELSFGPSSPRSRTSHKSNCMFLNGAILLYFFSLLILLVYPLLQAWPLNLNSENISQLIPAAARSLFLAAVAFILCLLFGLGSLASPGGAGFIRYSNFVGAPLIILGWLEIGVHPTHAVMQCLVVALGGFLIVFPWIHHSLKQQFDNIPTEVFELTKALGFTPRDKFKVLLWPQFRSPLLKLSGVVALWTLGDYGFSKAFFDGTSTLPLYIDEQQRHYSLSSAASGTLLAYLVSFVILTLIWWAENLRTKNYA